MKKNTLHISIFFLLVIILMACKSTKEVQKKIQPKGAKFLTEQMQNSQFAFDTIKLKASTELTVSGESNTFSVSLRAKKDSMMLLSVTKAGIQAFRILISVDSFKIINYIDDNFYLEDIDSLSRIFKLDLKYDMIEDMFFGNALAYNTEGKYNSIIDKNRYRLKEVGKRSKIDSLQAIYWLEGENYKIVKTLIESIKGDNNGLVIEYDDIEALEDSSTLIPTKVNLEAYSLNNNIQIEMNYSKIRINPETRFSFNIPEDYVRVFSLKELVKR